MQFGKSLATLCLEQSHQRACHRSNYFHTFAQLTSNFRYNADSIVRHTRCANLSTTACLPFEGTSSKQKRYRPRRPSFRRTSQNQEALPWTKDEDRRIDNLLSKNSETQAPQPNIELSIRLVDTFDTSDALRTTSYASARPESEDGIENKQTFADTRVPYAKTAPEELEEELQWIARNEPNPTDIKRILTILVQDRQIKPASKHYEALILANCNPEEGSSENLAAILEEMETNDIDIDAGVYAAALNVIAIHPSLPLTWSIVSSMQTRWISQTPQMTHALITIFIRTSQIELANDLLNELHKVNKPLPRNQRTSIPKYLYILLIRALVEKKDYEAVMRWLYRLHDRRAMGMDMPAEFWSWVLEQAARDGDGWVTGWLWQDWVEKMKVRPQRETCFNVMKIAARDGVAWLAESVKDVVNHCGFMEASRSELVQEVDWTKHHHDDGITSTVEPKRFLQESNTHKSESPLFPKVDYDEPHPSERASLLLLKMKSKRKSKTTPSKDASNLTRLTSEEESLLDTAYVNCDLNMNKKRGFKGDSSLGVGRGHNVDAKIADENNGDRRERIQKREQIKPGNLWPWFKNIEGYGNPRFDPWKALGPKSKP